VAHCVICRAAEFDHYRGMADIGEDQSSSIDEPARLGIERPVLTPAHLQALVAWSDILKIHF
jgi:hypothetical protein